MLHKGGIVRDSHLPVDAQHIIRLHKPQYDMSRCYDGEKQDKGGHPVRIQPLDKPVDIHPVHPLLRQRQQ